MVGILNGGVFISKVISDLKLIIREVIMKPYVFKEFSKPGFIENILKKNPEINLVIEVNNRLSSMEFTNFTGSGIGDILEKYKVKKFSKNLTNGLLDLLNEFLDFHLGNFESPYNNYSSAKKIQSFLQIEDKYFNEAYNTLAVSKTKKLLLDMVEDKEITDQEDEVLDEWKSKLNLSDNQISEIFQPIGQEIVGNYITEIIADERISPEEESNLTKLITGLRSNLEIDDKSKSMLERMKKLWLIENEKLDPIPVEIILSKNELCYFINNVDLFETRKVTKRVSYGGPTIRVKIVKGVYYRAGNLGVKAHSEEELAFIDSGKLYITNKRLLFVGSKQNKPVYLKNIIDFKVYDNGLEISKDTGKSPFYKMASNTDLAGAFLARCLKDSLSQ